VGGSDTVSRQGGDEFIVLLPELERAEDAALTARLMMETVAEVHGISEHDLHVTASIGISIYPDDGSDAETLVKNADTAMYHAKENGRQGYQFFKSEMNARAVERQSIEENLRKALERQELALHYQPKIDLKTGVTIGVEALLRWFHPSLGSVSPAQFIPVAEDSGLIVPIGAWVLREACTQAQIWSQAGLPPMTMSVNVSAIQFRHEDFSSGLATILQETGFDPKHLELEITESALVKRADRTASILKEVRAKGIQVSIDDFGTGYSSLSYLRKFPVDTLKIDQSFIRQITASDSERAMVRAIISMGRSLGLKVIAEGVETAEELDFIQHEHCDQAQGYYFSKPVPPEQLLIFLKTNDSNRIHPLAMAAN
jgi:predicted signal transduction protein with EAL and GGDEF domain